MKNITKFPKGFFKLKRKTISASEALKNAIPLKWEEADKTKSLKSIDNK